MSTKSFKAIKDLSKDELPGKIHHAEVELFKIKMQQATGQLKDTASLWKTRKQIARMKSVQTAHTAAVGKGK
jgi:ribosomal protein L29